MHELRLRFLELAMSRLDALVGQRQLGRARTLRLGIASRAFELARVELIQSPHTHRRKPSFVIRTKAAEGIVEHPTKLIGIGELAVDFARIRLTSSELVDTECIEQMLDSGSPVTSVQCQPASLLPYRRGTFFRSEERRVGKECSCGGT